MNSEGWISRNPPKLCDNLERKRGRSYDNSWGSYEVRAGRSGLQRQKALENNCHVEASGIHRQEVLPTATISHRNSGRAEGNRVGSLHGNTSRFRVPDNRGAAARVGALPSNCKKSSFPSSPNPNAMRDGVSVGFSFQNPSFLASVTYPPSITAKLPQDLSVSLNNEQCLVVESVLSGHSTFFTGPAGSGKSHVLTNILKGNELGIGGKAGQPRKIVVTATTGVAACAVGGITIHSFAGVGASGSAADMARRVMSNEYAKQRWREVDVLIIDEISMMSSSFLDKLSFIASRARNDRRPFGGVQLVVCGDFFQLPPVELNKDGFAFEAKCWSEVIRCSVLLTQVFRQQNDTALMNILDEARTGELSSQSIEILRKHSSLPAVAFGGSNRDEGSEKVIPTLLECRNRDVDKANEREMAKLPGDIHIFHSRDRAVSDSHKGQLKHCQAPSELHLKVGAQVILLKNVDLEKGLANGSRGVVVRFQPPKSDGDVPQGFKKMDLPVVRFDAIRSAAINEGELEDEDREFTIHPEEWINKMGEQTVSARVQIPLRLAWSISVHKSQGMTIPNLTVNLAGVFEYGQAYVALSRATELKLLTLRGFSGKVFRAHPKVKEFYRLLENGGSESFDTMTGKENLPMHPCGHFDIPDVNDPFNPNSEAEAKQLTEFHSLASSNPYQKKQALQSTISRNPYSKGVSFNRCEQPNPYTLKTFSKSGNLSIQQSNLESENSSGRKEFGVSKNPQPRNISPTFSQDQLQRMEENRLKALAKRSKKQRSIS